MHDALSLLGDLSDADIDWLLQVGEDRRLPAGATIIAEGATPRDLYFVLHGLAEVRIAALGDTRLATLGPGELLGEMSLVEERPASATVSAAEDVAVLAVTRDALTRRAADDAAFGARLYRAFARVAARRLRERVATLGRRADAALVAQPGWERVARALEGFKAAVQEADRAALANKGQIPPAHATSVREAFAHATSMVGDVFRSMAGDSDATRALGAALQRELLPYVLLTRSAERAYSKPRGYAGDYLMIEWTYRDEAHGTARVGSLIDRCFLDLPISRAVRNRRKLLANEIHRVIRASGERVARVTSMACGPARELFDVYRELESPKRLKATLIDIDPEALESVRGERLSLGLDEHVDLHLANLVHLATGRQRLELPPQQLVYSIGLIDYFEDRFVLNLIDHAYTVLQPGGSLILGNFHPRNPNRPILDYVVDWKLIYRTEDDMNRLYAASRFGRPASRVFFESEGINMFAECAKDA